MYAHKKPSGPSPLGFLYHQLIMPCSHPGCVSHKEYHFVDGQPRCLKHGFPWNTPCAHSTCSYKARTCTEGMYWCLRHGSSGTCSVCLDECGASGCVTTPCFHRFHAQCLDAWRERERGHTCPVCRAVIGSTLTQRLLFQYAVNTRAPDLDHFVLGAVQSLGVERLLELALTQV
jgi:hypothetical protein